MTNKLDGEFISYSMGMLSDKMIGEAVNARKKRSTHKWLIPAAVLMLLAILIVPFARLGNNDTSLIYNTAVSFEYRAPAITSTIITEPAEAKDAINWLGFDVSKILPDEMKDYTIKYTWVMEKNTKEHLGVIVEGKLSDAKYPKPGFYMEITIGEVLQQVLLSYENNEVLDTVVDGVSIRASVIAEKYETNQNGESKFTPAQLFAAFDINNIHCSIESRGQISDTAFGELCTEIARSIAK